MRRWSSNSLAVWNTLDPRLQYVVNELLVKMDVSLLAGHRGQREQDAYFGAGTSKVQWPNSKHNTLPSLAVDLQPYPMPTNPLELWTALGYMAGLAKGIGERRGIKLRWGGDWDGDGDVTDNKFDDLFHLEIV